MLEEKELERIQTLEKKIAAQRQVEEKFNSMLKPSVVNTAAAEQYGIPLDYPTGAIAGGLNPFPYPAPDYKEDATLFLMELYQRLSKSGHFERFHIKENPHLKNLERCVKSCLVELLGA